MPNRGLQPTSAVGRRKRLPLALAAESRYVGQNDVARFMNRYLYTAWFRNPSLPVDDQDHEWPACMLIDAPSEPDAIAWGDRLARRHSDRSGEVFLSSSLEPPIAADTGVPLTPDDGLPLVVAGFDATDAEIGW